MLQYQRIFTRVAAIHQNHFVNVAVVVERKFRKSFSHSRPWMDVNRRLLFASARRTSQIGPSVGIDVFIF